MGHLGLQGTVSRGTPGAARLSSQLQPRPLLAASWLRGSAIQWNSTGGVDRWVAGIEAYLAGPGALLATIRETADAWGLWKLCPLPPMLLAAGRLCCGILGQHIYDI